MFFLGSVEIWLLAVMKATLKMPTIGKLAQGRLPALSFPWGKGYT
jgi:hypothetical protein